MWRRKHICISGRGQGFQRLVNSCGGLGWRKGRLWSKIYSFSSSYPGKLTKYVGAHSGKSWIRHWNPIIVDTAWQIVHDGSILFDGSIHVFSASNASESFIVCSCSQLFICSCSSIWSSYFSSGLFPLWDGSVLDQPWSPVFGWSTAFCQGN